MDRSRWLKASALFCLLAVSCGRELKVKHTDLVPVYNHSLATILVQYASAVYMSDLTALITWTCERCCGKIQTKESALVNLAPIQCTGWICHPIDAAWIARVECITSHMLLLTDTGLCMLAWPCLHSLLDQTPWIDAHKLQNCPNQGMLLGLGKNTAIDLQRGHSACGFRKMVENCDCCNCLVGQLRSSHCCCSFLLDSTAWILWPMDELWLQFYLLPL